MMTYPKADADLSYLPEDERTARVDVELSIFDLCERCEECRIRIGDSK